MLKAYFLLPPGTISPLNHSLIRELTVWETGKHYAKGRFNKWNKRLYVATLKTS